MKGQELKSGIIGGSILGVDGLSEGAKTWETIGAIGGGILGFLSFFFRRQSLPGLIVRLPN